VLAQDCPQSPGSRPEPQYAFAKVAVPAGADACQDIGPLADPQIRFLANDGSNIAFSAIDYPHQGQIWYGDLADRSVKVVYKAAQSASSRTEVWRPQLVNGQLVWLELAHVGPDVNSAVKTWAIRDMDTRTRNVRTVLQGASDQPVHKVVTDFRYDGQRFALMEELPKGWQIEIADASGGVASIIPSSQDIFDLALVSDGVLYSTGIDDASLGTIGNMRLWHWSPGRGSRELGRDVFQICADGDLASWVSDPVASQWSTGRSQVSRLYAAKAPFGSPQPVSPAVTETGTKGIDGSACGSNFVAWWEAENWSGVWQDVLTLWRPDWTAARQVDTGGSESYRVALGGGWLVWSEELGREDAPLQERIRGVPLSVLTAQIP
jgi:hypothetical protein